MSLREVESLEHFGAIGGTDIPTIVNYSATWCGPCTKIKPTLERLASELEGKIQIFKLDIDKLPTAAKLSGVTSIPFFQVWRKGVIIDTWSGINETKERIIKISKP